MPNKKTVRPLSICICFLFLACQPDSGPGPDTDLGPDSDSDSGPELDTDSGPLPDSGPVGDELKIAALSVGPADSALIVFPTKKTMLVDSATDTNCERKVLPFFQRHGITHLDYYVETHPHDDHIGGRDLLVGGGYVDDETIRWDWETYDYEDAFVLEGTEIYISNAYDTTLNGDGINQNSLAFRLEYNGFVYSHGGDEYTVSMSRYLEDHPTLAKCHVRNTAHHMYGPVEKEYLVSIDPYLFIISNDSSIRSREFFQNEFLPAIETLEADENSRYQDYFILGEAGHLVIRAQSDEVWDYQTYPNIDSDVIPDFP